MARNDATEQTARFADMLAAMGTEPRLRIVRLLLAAHPEGLVVGDIAAELGIASSTLSHHLEKLRNDPWGRAYQYLNPGLRGEIDVFSFGADGKPGGTGHDADVGSWDL